MKAEERQNRLRVLEQVPLLRGLSRDSLRALADSAARLLPAAGATILRRGKECRGLLVVLSGRLEVYRGDDEETVLVTRGPGQSLGQLSLLRRSRCPASVRAARDSEVLIVPAGEFQQLIERDPEFCYAVVRSLAERVRDLADRLEMLASKDVRTREATALLRHSEAVGIDEDEWFELPQTQEELARDLLTTRESAARALRQLRDARLIEQEGARVRIRALQRLRGLAESNSDGLTLLIDPRELRDAGQ